MPGTVSFKTFYKPLWFAGGKETLLLASLLRRMELPAGPWKPPTDWGGGGEPMNLDPDYQRNHVWTDAQAEKFVGHLIEGGATPLIIINRSADFKHHDHDEVVDGKQRLTAAVRWLKGEIPAELTDGRRVFYNDLDDLSKRYLTGLSGAHMDIGYVQLTRPEVLRLYLRLNRGGTIHTDDEIDRVRDLLAAEETP